MNKAEEALIRLLKLRDFSKEAKAMMMAQGAAESGKFKRLVESFAYTPEGLVKVFPHYFSTVAFAKIYVDKGPEAIANVVYANRMGNGNFGTGDGWKFRGRGIIMLTGRNNYALHGRLIGKNLVSDPELAARPDIAAQITVSYFTQRPWLMKAANAGDVLAASSWINLGNYNPGQIEKPLGLKERTAYYQFYLKMCPF